VQRVMSDCKYLLIHPLYDKPPESMADSVGFALSSDTVTIPGTRNMLFIDRQVVARRRVVNLKGVSEGIYKFRLSYSQLEPNEPPTKFAGRDVPGMKLMAFEYEFRIGDETYYEMLRDSQTKAGFRITPIPDSDALRTITRNRFMIPDCRYVDDGVSW
jgi:hypothetical protein